MSSDQDLRRLAQIRANRTRSMPDLTIRREAIRIAGVLRRQAKAFGPAADAWAECMPDELSERTQLIRFARGVLTVRVEDASTKFQIDRLLRSGAQQALVETCAVPIRKVKLVL